MSTFTASDGARLVYTRLGAFTSDPIVVIPGGACRGVDYLEDLAGAVDERGAVIFHPRGTPTSGGLSNGWWSDADDVVALLDALGLPSADVIAHSAGTRLALSVAVRFAPRVRRVVQITPPATWLTGTEHDGEAIGRARGESVVDEALLSMRTEPAPGQAAFDHHRAIEGPAGYARWTEREQRHNTVGDWAWDADLAWFRGIPDDAAARVLAAGVPDVAVIGGADDIYTGREPVHRYAEILGARLIELTACGHYPWVEQPDAFRAAVRELLAR
ncbi:alpha/beta fold hydrolase [Microbacterium gorillae]|uniref:alpha/beta fold hydrolase n=1 Tax=Microbacterium gorillae TaxID=1231063 RepID=UPI00058BA7EB|nr:alpha/beta hydrolase [Microbacterium gorillae]